jgi:hypothetical protein
VAALAVTPPAAVASNGVRLTINGGASRHIALSDIEANANIAPIRTTDRPGGAYAPDRQQGGTSASAFVEKLAHIPLDALVDTGVAMTVMDGRGATATLISAEAKGPISGDPLGQRSATFDSYTGSSVYFFKPLTDPDGSTYLINPVAPDDLLVDINTKGRLLAVHLDAPAQVQPKDTVHFSATVDTAVSNATYEWDFGDGSAPQQTNDDPTISHVYADGGRFSAQVTITTKDGSSGTDSVPILVGTPAAGGTPPNAPPPPPGLLTGGGGTPGGGGTGKTGGGKGGSKAPTTGHASGGRQDTSPAAKRKTSTAKRNDKTPTGRKKRSTANPAAAPPPPPPPLQATGKQRAAGARKPSRGAADRQRNVRTPPPAASGRGLPITGILLAGTSPFESALPALKPAAADALARTAARAAAGSPGGLLGWLGVGSLSIAVLLCGAALEMHALARRTRPPTPAAA